MCAMPSASPICMLLLCSLLFNSANSILLCDGDCRNITELGICQKPLANKTILPVMAFFPCNVDGFRARGLTVAAQMAVKKVFQDTSILSGYILQLEVANTMCSPLPAIRAFIDQLALVQQSQRRYMIIGPGCSGGASTTAEVAPFYSLTQIGYTTTGVSLSDQTLFPNFLRSISSDNASVATVTALVRQFGWRHVAIVNTRDVLFTNLTSVQVTALERSSLPDRRIEVQTFPFDDPRTNTARNKVLGNIIDNLQASGSRVILLNIGEELGRVVFCLAYKRGMRYPEYTFISHYWWSEYWWTDGVGDTNCTVQELTDAIYRSLAVDHFPLPTGKDLTMPTAVGYSSSNEFWTDFEFNLKALGYPSNEALRQAAFVYDAVWMAAFALNNASLEIQNNRIPGVTKLEDFNQFENASQAMAINNLILNAAKSIVFRGVSGKVKLNVYGDREPIRRVYQYHYRTVIDPNTAVNIDFPFARVEDNGDLVFINNQSIDTVYLPEDGGVTRDVELVSINMILFAVYTVLAILGIIFAVICLVFNIVFRKKRIVKLSSPYLNLLLISGAIIYYIVVIMFGLDTSFVPFVIVDILRCQCTVWLASIGFSLLFGTMLAKTWRVYYIFRNIRLKKRPMKDWVLVLIVSVMVAVDVAFLIIVSVDLFRIRLEPQPLVSRDGEIPNLYNRCTSSASTIWIPILLAYKALYLLVGVFLAVQTYNVKLKRLRDSKLIVACVCTISVVALVASIIGLTVTNMPNVSYGLYGAFILVVVTAILFILFGTLMIDLYKNPSGDIEVGTVGGAVDGASRYLDSRLSTDDHAKVEQLKSTIRSLKRDIETRKRVTMDLDPSHRYNASSPVNNDAGLNSSNVNLLQCHVTSSPDHVTSNAYTNSHNQQVSNDDTEEATL